MNIDRKSQPVDVVLSEVGGKPHLHFEASKFPDMEEVIRLLEAEGYEVSRDDFMTNIVAVCNKD